MRATVGRIVHFGSKIGDGAVSPAIVLRTRESSVPPIPDPWGVLPVVPELPDDETVDLLVHGLGSESREYSVPHAEQPTPGHWSWPPLTPAPVEEPTDPPAEETTTT